MKQLSTRITNINKKDISKLKSIVTKMDKYEVFSTSFNALEKIKELLENADTLKLPNSTPSEYLTLLVNMLIDDNDLDFIDINFSFTLKPTEKPEDKTFKLGDNKTTSSTSTTTSISTDTSTDKGTQTDTCPACACRPTLDSKNPTNASEALDKFKLTDLVRAYKEKRNKKNEEQADDISKKPFSIRIRVDNGNIYEELISPTGIEAYNILKDPNYTIDSIRVTDIKANNDIFGNKYMDNLNKLKEQVKNNEAVPNHVFLNYMKNSNITTDGIQTYMAETPTEAFELLDAKTYDTLKYIPFIKKDDTIFYIPVEINDASIMIKNATRRPYQPFDARPTGIVGINAYDPSFYVAGYINTRRTLKIDDSYYVRHFNEKEWIFDMDLDGVYVNIIL